MYNTIINKANEMIQNGSTKRDVIRYFKEVYDVLPQIEKLDLISTNEFMKCCKLINVIKFLTSTDVFVREG